MSFKNTLYWLSTIKKATIGNTIFISELPGRVYSFCKSGIRDIIAIKIKCYLHIEKNNSWKENNTTIYQCTRSY